METLFWSRLDDLIASSKIIIDRPKDKPHPNWPDMIFPLDYGYLEGTTAMDGGGRSMARSRICMYLLPGKTPQVIPAVFPTI